MQFSNEELRQNYARLTDVKIFKLATQDTDSLTPEAKEILQEELEKRGVTKSVDQLIDLQKHKPTEDNILHYCRLLQNLPCPKCKQTTTALNGTTIYNTAGLFFIGHYEERIEVACPTCLDKKNYGAMLSSAIMGWWMIIPFGPYRTIKAILGNSNSISQNGLLQPNPSLQKFVQQNYTEIEMWADNTNELELLIKPI